MAYDLSKLGVTLNIPKVQFTDYSGLIQAESKFGKTELVAQLPQTILVAFEKGYDASVIQKIDCTDRKSGWKNFIDFIDRLEKDRKEIGTEIKLIAIDTLEEAYAACEVYMLRRESVQDGVKYNDIGDLWHGRGYTKKDNYFRAQIKRLYALGFRPLYLTHTEIKTVKPKSKNEEPYDIFVPSIPERCRKIVFPEVSYILHGTREVIDGKLTRVFKTVGNQAATVGSRLFLGEDIPFDSETEFIEKFAQVWRNMIEAKLNKSGIRADLDELAQKQDAESLTEALAGNTLAKAVKELKEVIKELVTAKKITNRQVVETFAEFHLKSPEEVPDVETAESLTAKFQEYA